MLTQIALNRDTGDGRYADVIDAAEKLASQYGSAANALAVMARQSQHYQSVQPKPEGNGADDSGTVSNSSVRQEAAGAC